MAKVRKDEEAKSVVEPAETVEKTEKAKAKAQVKGSSAEPVEKPAKNVKKADKAKDKAKKQKKPNWFKALGSELKKVTWPTFGKVVKQTGIVIGVVLFFMVIVGAIDVGLGALYRLLISH